MAKKWNRIVDKFFELPFFVIAPMIVIAVAIIAVIIFNGVEFASKTICLNSEFDRRWNTIDRCQEWQDDQWGAIRPRNVYYYNKNRER